MNRPKPHIRYFGHWTDSNPGSSDVWVPDRYEVSLDGGVTWEEGVMDGMISGAKSSPCSSLN